MGVKRPFEEEEFPGFPLKLSKQFDMVKNLTCHEEDFPSPKASLESDFHVLADKELETSSLLSWTPGSNSEDNMGIENGSFGSYFPAYFDFTIPQQPEMHFENPYFSFPNFSPRKEVSVGPDHRVKVQPRGVNFTEKDYVNDELVADNYIDERPTQTYIVQLPQASLFRPPRKEVPIGSDHQAEVLLWDTNFSEKGYEDSNERELRLMGTCILPMPDDSDMDGVEVGRERTTCSCFDSGSEKCVRLHVSEAREAVRESIGDDKFADLGFYDMGETMAFKWTSEDEHLFHEIVFDYPMSLGRNFWRHLSAAFPTRTKNEIISYYFNVFMLRRRAIQNRSVLLDVDSDDDEQKGADLNLNPNRSHFDGSNDEDDASQDDDTDENVGGSDSDRDEDDNEEPAKLDRDFYRSSREEVKPDFQSMFD